MRYREKVSVDNGNQTTCSYNLNSWRDSMYTVFAQYILIARKAYFDQSVLSTDGRQGRIQSDS